MPRRGRVDVPQPILHPIASHATFDTAAPAPTPAIATAPQPPSAPEQKQHQQQHGGNPTRTEQQPPPDQLSFSYLRSRKLEPYLPPPVDEHHPPPSLTLTHNFAHPPPPPPQHHHHHQHPHHAGAAAQQQASSPESPPPSAHDEEEHQPHHHHHHHQHHHHHHEGDHSDHDHDHDEEEEQDEDDEEEEEDLDWKPRPFITLTYAQSLDSAIASSPGARTALSGPSTKAMTHFLRSRHDAILVGVGTAAADDPGLNCRLEVEMSGGHQPRPVVVDPAARWAVGGESKVVQLAREGRGLGPWVLCAEGVVPDPARVAVLEGVGGRYITVEGAKGARGDGGKEVKGDGWEMGKEGEEEDGSRSVLTWDSIFGLLWEEGINSVMVEGGATVINDLLLLANEGLDVVDSFIVTIAPVWLGAGGVTVAPERPVDAHMRRVPGPRLTDVMWSQMGDDMVLCGRIMR
ncbi:riboflavin biosynthesis protein Rib7 [Diaporthe eres]|uniref:2,5-diamino-6-ribosylamino-4(3H)-pyrimidinone 5'-phosphate reductase n=1 Tax=Diaporthe vaccinii TaxID=105482 RepID=A0ABR4DSF0_9PEZI|nr:riboflavin biosynthesis protein Rib7 [Diaporthe eres]